MKTAHPLLEIEGNPVEIHQNPQKPKPLRPSGVSLLSAHGAGGEGAGFSVRSGEALPELVASWGESPHREALTTPPHPAQLPAHLVDRAGRRLRSHLRCRLGPCSSRTYRT